MEKICKICRIPKPIEEFHTHKGCKDGHVGVCKRCVCEGQKSRYKILMQNPEFVMSERIRGRKKQRNKPQKVRRTGKIKLEDTKKYRAKYPEKTRAKYAVQNNNIHAKPGFHLHHWSYNDDHFLDVIEIDVKKHLAMHTGLRYDQPRKMYVDARTGELLDTREKSIFFIETFDYANY